MAKEKTEAKTELKSEEKQIDQLKEMEARLPPEVAAKLKAAKEKVDKFKKAILDKYDKSIMGIALLPPPREQPSEPGIPPKPVNKDEIHILVLADDSSIKPPKFEWRENLFQTVEKTAKEIDPLLKPQTLLLQDLWQNCYDGKSDLLQLIALGAPVHDTGMLSAIKIAEVHKTMVLKKFEKYIVAYVLAGSLVQGRATKESDIDVFIVIDDTDVKKMTRVELKDKLRAIIIQMGFDAGEITGIRNKINIQVYILTDFWDSMREANPVIFTFLRDGVPFYDRGIFMPWKQLLKMGKIKPSTEAIDMYMSSGEQMLERVKFKLRDMAMEDFFWSIQTPSQAALMLYGVPPPTPKETVEVMREIFVKKEKLLENKDVDILESIIQLRKDLEHGVKKDVTGKELDQHLDNADKYLKRLKKLFTQIEKKKEDDTIVSIYDTLLSVIRDALKLEGREKIAEVELVKCFEDDLISTGKIPSKFLRSLNVVIEAKKHYDDGTLTKIDVEQTRKEAQEIVKVVVEYIQRKRVHELQRAKVRVQYDKRFGELTIVGENVFVVKDIDSADRKFEVGKLKPDGSIGPLEDTSYDNFEKAISKSALPKVSVTEPFFLSLKLIFGKDVKVLM
ncbi:MAG: nucleotidyltransferase domain-containing protein [Candidatus Aenigmarchaeota archaeon]|nr:nucleotidyltransferase domain-containing protein [Candidatus Aenigmarchaeota archaeon]